MPREFTITRLQLFGPERPRFVEVEDTDGSILLEVPEETDLDYELQEYTDYQRCVQDFEAMGFTLDQIPFLSATNFHEWLQEHGAKMVQTERVVDPGW